MRRRVFVYCIFFGFVAAVRRAAVCIYVLVDDFLCMLSFFRNVHGVGKGRRAGWQAWKKAYKRCFNSFFLVGLSLNSIYFILYTPATWYNKKASNCGESDTGHKHIFIILRAARKKKSMCLHEKLWIFFPIFSCELEWDKGVFFRFNLLGIFYSLSRSTSYLHKYRSHATSFFNRHKK